MTDQPSPRQQDWDLADGFFELIGNIVGQAEQLAQRLNVPVPFIKALHMLDCPMAMKELGRRLHCDPSFVTLVADMLEQRGLARREPHLADRRIKNLVLTEDGVALKRRVEAELSSRMPWNRALSDSERTQLLALIRKMLGAGPGGGTGQNDADTDHSPSADAAGVARPAAAAAVAAGISAVAGHLAGVLASGQAEHAPGQQHQSPGFDGGGE